MIGNLTVVDFTRRIDSTSEAMGSLLGLLVMSFLPFFQQRTPPQCLVINTEKLDCGFVGSTQESCESEGCCWQPIEPNPWNVPWCYHKANEDVCNAIHWKASGPGGFDDEMYDLMYKNFLSQLNVENSGAVVAAPDRATPGGSYYFHWMRDAALSIKTLLDINNNDYETVKVVAGMYSRWVEKVQNKTDPNAIDVRVEPKFTIPDGDPFTGPWCRPQTDGPALRAMALSQWGRILHHAGKGDPSHVWSLVQFDLEWVSEHWASEGCDLWEEVQSDDFYFNRMSYVYSLNVAADFGDLIGQPGGRHYRALANTIKTTVRGHWRPEDGFLYQSDNRPLDGSVIQSIATFGSYLYPPDSEEAASTVDVLSKKFCREYPINQRDNGAGEPGVLIGRYPGDVYAGGNPWQLLTAATAELFYLGARATLQKIRTTGIYSLDEMHNKKWLKLLNLPAGIRADRFADAQLEAGDAVMTRLYAYVKDDGGRIDEQMEKNTGAQTSAKSLTWSYANILHALHVRKSLLKDMQDARTD